MTELKVYARYDGPRVRDYITPGELYPVVKDLGDAFTWFSDEGKECFATWNSSAHLGGESWTRVELPVVDSSTAATLREIADVIDAGGDPVEEFEISSSVVPWRKPDGPSELLCVCGETEHWQVRRNPKTVRVEGEVSRDVIDRAHSVIRTKTGGNAETVAQELLSLVLVEGGDD